MNNLPIVEGDKVIGEISSGKRIVELLQSGKLALYPAFGPDGKLYECSIGLAPKQPEPKDVKK